MLHFRSDWAIRGPSWKVRFHTISNLLLKEKQRPFLMLDLGCGTGRFSFPMQSKGVNVVGVDVSSLVLKLAINDPLKKRFPAEFVRADAHSLPFKSKAVDATICIDTLEHLNKDNQVVDEIARTLKRKGAVVFVVPCRNPLSLDWFMAKIRGIYPFYRGDVRDKHLHRYRSDEFVFMLRNSGLNTLKIIFHGHFLHPLVRWYILDPFFRRKINDAESIKQLQRLIERSFGRVASTILQLVERIDLALSVLPPASVMFVLARKT